VNKFLKLFVKNLFIYLMEGWKDGRMAGWEDGKMEEAC
jgi:hypothetical protein